MTKTTDRMLIDIQSVAIELAEYERDLTAREMEVKELKEKVAHNADIYQRDLSHLMAEADGCMDSSEPEQAYLFDVIKQTYENGRGELRSAESQEVVQSEE